VLFKGSDFNEIMKNNKKCDLERATRKMYNLSPKARDLVLGMLELDYDKRLTAAEVLQHEWFQIDHNILNRLLSFNKQFCLNKQNRG
jgi:serine/threonine protein kinase